MPEEQWHIAIVDSDMKSVYALADMLKNYYQNTGAGLTVQVFESVDDFIDRYEFWYDIAFITVPQAKPHEFESIKRLRMMDKFLNVIIISDTKAYALDGYELAVRGYILKPIDEKKVGARIKNIDVLRKYIIIKPAATAALRILFDDILYIIKDKNYIVYNTRSAQYRVQASMKNIESKFEGSTILKCGNGCMVNIKHIDKKVNNTVFINGVGFSVTEPYREKFFGRLRLLSVFDSFSCKPSK